MKIEYNLKFYVKLRDNPPETFNKLTFAKGDKIPSF